MTVLDGVISNMKSDVEAESLKSDVEAETWMIRKNQSWFKKKNGR